jgi:glycosyltransferase involved in cell wall biosynthesis
MPKTGLLGMLAAWLAAVPVRIHTFTGQTWANDEGLRRWIFIQLDRLTARLATHILVDSQSQLEFLRSCRICPGAKGQVLGEGSVCGVDVQRFAPSAEVRGEVRAACGIAADDIVVLFVGRLCVDKGVLDLCAVFERLYQRYRHVRLLVAGPQDGLSVTDLQSVCGKARKNLHYVGSTNVVERYMAAADMFCLPSYREGFGQVVIEAAACQLPVVASDIYGLRDSVVDNVTGLLFPIRDQDRMLVLLDQLAKDRSLRDRLGANGRERVMRDFQESGLTFALVEFYAVALAH